MSWAMIWVKTSLARRGAQACRVIQGADHILDNFLAVGIAGAFLGDFAPTMHDDDTIGSSEDIRQRMTTEDRGHALAAESPNQVENFAPLDRAQDCSSVHP